MSRKPLAFPIIGSHLYFPVIASRSIAWTLQYFYQPQASAYNCIEFLALEKNGIIYHKPTNVPEVHGTIVSDTLKIHYGFFFKTSKTKHNI